MPWGKEPPVSHREVEEQSVLAEQAPPTSVPSVPTPPPHAMTVASANAKARGPETEKGRKLILEE
jgi:hypothetical protein